MSGTVPQPRREFNGNREALKEAGLKAYFRSRGACVREIEELDFGTRYRMSLCFLAGHPVRVPDGWRVESMRRVLVPQVGRS